MRCNSYSSKARMKIQSSEPSLISKCNGSQPKVYMRLSRGVFENVHASVPPQTNYIRGGAQTTVIFLNPHVSLM